MPQEEEKFINLPFEKPNLDFVEKNLKYVVLIGIGGSSLGAKAIYKALRPRTQMIFLETVGSDELKETADLINSLKPSEYIVNAVSKSGKTLETVTNLDYLLENCPEVKNRLVVTTQKDSSLYKTAESLDAKILELPEWTSGKFSVFSSVGIFPLACASVNVDSLLNGAREANESEAAKSAQKIFDEMQRGKSIHNLFVFEPRLEFFGKWYEQLISESLGRDGKGLTPTTSIGTIDLHSKTQLDLGGPEDKIFTFLRVKLTSKTSDLPNAVKNALYLAAKRSYEKKFPVTEIELADISEKSLGKLMQTKMLEIMLLAELLGINPFGQPDVEEYKKYALQIISEPLAS